MAFTDPTCPGTIFYEPGDPEFEEVNRESNRRCARTWEFDGTMVMQTMRRALGIEEEEKDEELEDDSDPDDDLEDKKK